MANRILGNVYLLDSGLQTLSFPTKASIRAIALYGADTTARLVLTLVSDTRDAVVALANPVHFPNTTGITFGGDTGWAVADTLRVLNLTAGTGYIYFC